MDLSPHYFKHTNRIGEDGRYDQLNHNDWAFIAKLIVRISLAIGFIVGVTYSLNEYYHQREAQTEHRETVTELIKIIAVPLYGYDFYAVQTAARIFDRDQKIISFRISDSENFYVAGDKNFDAGKGNVGIIPIFVPNQLPGSANQIGTAEFEFRSPALTTVIFDAFLRSLLAALIISLPASIVVWSYLRNYVHQPLQQLRSAMDETIKTGEHRLSKYSENTAFGDITQRFDRMQHHLSNLRRDNTAAVDARNEAMDSLQRLNAQLSWESKERQQNSEMLQSVFAATNQNIIFRNGEGEVLATSAKDIANKNIRRLLDNPPFTLENLKRLLGDQIRELQILPISGVDGVVGAQKYTHHYSAEVEFTDRSSWFIRALDVEGDMRAVIASDVSEMRRVNRELNAARKMEAMGVLTGGVAHDFNNLLAIIMGNAEVLETSPNILPEQKAPLRIIVKTCNRAGALIQQLLAFSKKKPAQQQNVNLRQMFGELETVIHTVLGPEIALSIKITTDKSVRLDSDLLYSAVLNFTNNARKAMSETGVLSISVDDAPPNLARQRGLDITRDYILLQFRDNGHGMSDEIRERIFEPFFSQSDTKTGTGLGLAMVYSFAKQSHGSVWCESEFDIGTTFYLALPASHKLQKEKVKPDAVDLNKLNGLKLAIVDDETNLVDLLETYFVNLGAKVQTFGNATEIEHHMADQGANFDVLITDSRLPDGNGSEIAEMAKKLSPETATILISGNLDSVDDNQAINSLIAKPFRLTEISDKVLKLV